MKLFYFKITAAKSLVILNVVIGGVAVVDVTHIDDFTCVISVVFCCFLLMTL